MTEEQRDLLCRGLTRLGVPYTPEAVERLGLYCRRLLEKNQVMNLTAITDPADVMTLHFLDSAALLPTRALGGRKLIDVGTGAGFPGLVLRILDSTIRLTLLDSLGKRVEWLTELCRELDLPDVVLLKGRAEELSRRKTHREQLRCGGLPGSGRHAHAGGAVPALCQARRPLSGHEEQQDR